MATNYPKHPIYSWKPTITGSVSYDDGVASGSINLATDIGSSYWGWDSDASDIASSASMQGKLLDLLDAAMGFSAHSVTYTWPDGDAAPPLSSYAISHGSNVALTFSSTAVAAQFGFSSSAITITPLVEKVADFTDAGHWQPSCYGGSDERWEVNPNVGVTETIDGSSRKLRTWGATLTDRALVHPTVMVANIRSDAAADTSQAAMAQRDTSDPNSLLENMIEAAREPESTDNARAFRVYTDAGVYRTCYWLDTDQITDLAGLCSSQSARRVWSVSLNIRDNG
jgi:hypothetical protein